MPAPDVEVIITSGESLVGFTMRTARAREAVRTCLGVTPPVLHATLFVSTSAADGVKLTLQSAGMVLA